MTTHAEAGEGDNDPGSRAVLERALTDLELERAAFGQDLGNAQGRLARFGRRVVRRLLRWYAAPQAAWNDDACRALRELAALTARQAARIAELEALAHRDGPPSTSLDPGGLPRQGPAPAPPWTPSLAQELAERGSAVVLGAGHGWRIAELARTAPGLDVRGVEVVAAWAEEARAAGFAVEHRTASSALARVPAATLAAIAIDRLVEETALDALLELLRAARDALIPGGLVVATAVNPAHRLAPALVAARVGPTRLVAPALLAALGAAAGLVDVGAYPLGSATAPQRVLAPPFALPDDAAHYGMAWRALG